MSEVFKARVGQPFACAIPNAGVDPKFKRRAVFIGPTEQGGNTRIETDLDFGGSRVGGGLGLSGTVPADAPVGHYTLLHIEQLRVADGATNIVDAADVRHAPELEVLPAIDPNAFPTL